MTESTIWGIHMEWDDATIPQDKKDIAIGWPDPGNLNALPASRDAFKAAFAKKYPTDKLGAVPVKVTVTLYLIQCCVLPLSRKLPRVQQQRAGRLEIPQIARDQRHAMRQRRRRDQRIPLVARVGNMQARAASGDECINRKNPAVEGGRRILTVEAAKRAGRRPPCPWRDRFQHNRGRRRFRRTGRSCR